MEETKSQPDPADIDETQTPKKPLEETAKEVMDEMSRQNLAQAYQGAVLDRKKESYAHYQALENERTNTIESHKVIISNLVANLYGKLTIVESGIEKVVKFLKDRAAQEEEYVKIMNHGLPKLGAAFKDPNDTTQFINFARAMQECDDFHLRQSVNSESLAKFIRKNILEAIVLPAEKEFKKQLSQLQTPFEGDKKKLASVSQGRLKHSKTYVLAYNEAQRGSKITKDKDMFKREMENVSLGYDELRLVKSLAGKALVLWNEVAKLLMKRLDDIQKALNLYFQKYTDVYGNKAANPDPVVQLMAQLNCQDEVQQALRVRNIINPEDLEYLRKKTGKTEVSFQEVCDILANIPPPPDLAASPLVLKEWKAKREGSLLKGSKQFSVIVSLDGNVLVVERTPEGEMIATDTILTLHNLKILPKQEKKDPAIVDVVEVTPGVLLDSKKKVSLKFTSEDSAEEFVHYVNNFIHVHELRQKK